jgi:glutamate dehydrogenase/leucine dehydrogenase
MGFDVTRVMQAGGHEAVLFGADPETGMRAVIAIHSTALGPALGGTRMYPYPTEDEALNDVLRLAEGSAAAGLNLGGGKAVIIGDPRRHKSMPLCVKCCFGWCSGRGGSSAVLERGWS